MRYGAITIFKMAAVRHVEFSKFDIFLSFSRRVRAIMPPHSNFGLNRTIWSRVKAKNDVQYGVRPPSWIWEFLNFCHVSSPYSKFASAYQISSNLDDSRLRYGVITVFKMAAVRLVGFSKFDIFIICDRALMISYWRSIVTMALSSVVFEIFNVEKYRDLEIRVRGHSRSLKVVPFGRSCMVSY